MPSGDKSRYTDKQKRQAAHIEKGYENRGVPEKEAERRAWSTVNATSGGGKKSGSGRGKATDPAPAKKGGAASAARTPEQRSASAKKAAATRARNKAAGR